MEKGKSTHALDCVENKEWQYQSRLLPSVGVGEENLVFVVEVVKKERCVKMG